MIKKYTFDAENSLWYEQCGEYQLPCLTVPNSKNDRQDGDSTTAGISVSISTALIPRCCL